MPTPVFDKLKNGAATINEKTKKSVAKAVKNVKTGVAKGAESVKKGMNLAIAKITAPIRRGNKRVKKTRKRRKPRGFFPDETETEKDKKSWFRLARQCV